MNKTVPNYNPATDGDMSGFMVMVNDYDTPNGHGQFLEINEKTSFFDVMKAIELAAMNTPWGQQFLVEVFQVDCDGGIYDEPLISTVIDSLAPLIE